MKTLPGMKISDQLDVQIRETIKISNLRKADVVREALRIGLPLLAARFQAPPHWLEERIRQALAELGEPVSKVEFSRRMKVIANGR